MTSRNKDPRQRHERPRGVPLRPPGMHVPKGKRAGGLICSDCGVIQHRGRWFFGAPPATQLDRGTCPACRRIRDNYPAGTLRLDQSFLAHRNDLIGLMRNVEKAEKAEHPLERIMGIQDKYGELVVTTTGVHLARALAHKLGKQFQRRPRFRYADNEQLVHVDWDVAGPER